MKDRLYDPVVHRFLQPDDYIQDPSNTQNFNRYGYCYNNPFKYTDPSGEFFWFIPIAIIIVSAAINIYSNWDDITAGTGKFSDINWGRFVGYGAVGAVSGALTIYGGLYGVIMAGGSQGFLNLVIQGNSLQTILKDLAIGSISGMVSYGINVRFEKLLPSSLIGGNNLLYSFATGALRDVVSNFGGLFAGEFSSIWDFETSVKNSPNPVNLISSVISGSLSSAVDFESSFAVRTPSPLVQPFTLIPLPPMLSIIPIRPVISSSFPRNRF